jgi:lipopolysaccharide/colanic/teichoic acid biosynthesis glycosyltransferase
MELVLQAPGIAIEQPKRKTAAYSRNILRIEQTHRSSDKTYIQDNINFNCVTIKEALHLLSSGNEGIDAILFNPNVSSDIVNLRDAARKQAIPLIIYTPIYEPAAKTAAINVCADDYHFGPITSAFLKRVEFIQKVKSYKNQRGNKPYVTQTLDLVPQIKLWSLKRVFDILVSATALLLLSPLCLLVALIIRMESKGPIFYISKRAGSGYKIFNFYKFRSMRTGADAQLKNLAHLNQYSSSNNSVFFKIKDDPRITPFGHFIRKTSLDEIPQLLNVLLGDMSLVGNRPLPLYEAEKLTKDQIAWRFLAPAGITGLWQITKRGKDNMSEDERIALDMEYAMKNSFWLDMKILFSTIPALIQKEKV